jgi:hypothetical protein
MKPTKKVNEIEIENEPVIRNDLTFSFLYIHQNNHKRNYSENEVIFELEIKGKRIS